MQIVTEASVLALAHFHQLALELLADDDFILEILVDAAEGVRARDNHFLEFRLVPEQLLLGLLAIGDIIQEAQDRLADGVFVDKAGEIPLAVRHISIPADKPRGDEGGHLRACAHGLVVFLKMLPVLRINQRQEALERLPVIELRLAEKLLCLVVP